MKNRPAVLVNPPITLQERYGKLSAAGSSLPPFALMGLASYARENGFESAIVDAEALRLTVDETVEAIVALDPWVVGFTATTLSVGRAAEVAEKLKEARPDLPTVIGGPHFTALPEPTLSLYRQFDVGAFGEGEETWRELLTGLRSGDGSSDLAKIDGLVLRQGPAVVRTRPRAPIEPLDRLPLPAWDLLPELNRHYQPSALRQHRSPTSALVTTRGCFGSCTFCYNSVFGRRVRAFSAGYVLRMVRHLVERFGVRDITFYDDNFVHPRQRLRELFSMVRAEGIDLTWSANSRVDVVDRELLTTMRESGCWQLSWGIESGDQRILDHEAKHITIEQVRRALDWSHRAGIRNKGFFIIGHPMETPETIAKTIELALQLPLDDFQMSFLTPFPGTQVFAQASQYGTMTEDWDRMNMWTPVFVPNGLTEDDLVSWQKTAIRRFYFRPRIVLGYLAKLDSLARWRAFARGALAVLGALLPGRAAVRPKPVEAAPEPGTTPALTGKNGT
ncbi:MAG: cobalamin B12-binding domain-containing protein [Candidatus Riflebacteria bacterium]|nr:cobalamin B12-binding domain-containing protein [Candidatus Riflebacteria bacterium]